MPISKLHNIKSCLINSISWSFVINSTMECFHFHISPSVYKSSLSKESQAFLKQREMLKNISKHAITVVAVVKSVISHFDRTRL